MRRHIRLAGAAMVAMTSMAVAACIPPVDPTPGTGSTTSSSTTSSSTSTSSTTSTTSITTSSTTTTLPADGEPTGVATGDRHSCVLMSGGTVTCWGDNTYGQSGSTVTTSNQPPTSVAGLGGVTQISAGGFHTCALLDDGEVRCWGSNYNGQIGPLGDGGALVANPSPLPVGIDDAVEVAAGWLHSCALHVDGSVSCWGSNTYGEIGRLAGFGAGGKSAFPSPERIQDLAGVSSLSVEGRHSCALLEDATMSCWGSNLDGQLGLELDTGLDGWYRPTPVAGLSGVVAIGSGIGVTCAILDSSAPNVRCWGGNYTGNLGNPVNYRTEYPTYTPTPVEGLPDAVAVSIGQSSCALATDGQLWCWGDYWGGAAHQPVPYPGATDIRSFDTTGTHLCALSGTNEVLCFGRNDKGQLGRPGGADPVPAPVLGL